VRHAREKESALGIRCRSTNVGPSKLFVSKRNFGRTRFSKTLNLTKISKNFESELVFAKEKSARERDEERKRKERTTKNAAT